MMPAPTGRRHDATKGTYITCLIVLVLAILLVIWALRGGPFSPTVSSPTPIPVVIVTPDTEPPVPTAPAPIPTGVPTGVPTRTLLNAMALHDGTVPLFEDPPCWSSARRPRPTCTPTITPFPPSPTDTAVPTATATDTPTATGTAVPTGTPSVEPWRDPPADVLAEEAELARLINEYRVSIGRAPLAVHPTLTLGQRWWAYEMVTTNQCYHGDYGGRAYSLGYQGFAWGEAGACGYPNAAEALQGWKDSPGHNGIVIADEAFGCRFDEMGVAAWRYPNGYWQHWLLVGASTCN